MCISVEQKSCMVVSVQCNRSIYFRCECQCLKMLRNQNVLRTLYTWNHLEATISQSCEVECRNQAWHFASKSTYYIVSWYKNFWNIVHSYSRESCHVAVLCKSNLIGCVTKLLWETHCVSQLASILNRFKRKGWIIALAEIHLLCFICHSRLAHWENRCCVIFDTWSMKVCTKSSMLNGNSQQILSIEMGMRQWERCIIIEFSSNVFTKFAEFSDKSICYYSKRVQTCHPVTSCVRDKDATTAPARHMWETGSMNWAQFMLQWFIRFLEFSEFLSRISMCVCLVQEKSCLQHCV